MRVVFIVSVTAYHCAINGKLFSLIAVQLRNDLKTFRGNYLPLFVYCLHKKIETVCFRRVKINFLTTFESRRIALHS